MGKTYGFYAVSLCNEINFNEISKHFGIDKKYKWEEYLTLGENNLKGIINNFENKKVKIFHFGSIVFINMVYNEMMDVVNYLKKIEKNISGESFQFADDYELEITESEEVEINFDRMAVSSDENNIDIISVVLAKSVALERVEAKVEKLIDDSEIIINALESGKFSIKYNRISKMIASILQFKHSIISYILLLDKPDVTWKNQYADEIYIELSHIFELEDRYNTVSSKTETLMDIVEVFSSLMQARKGNILEYTVIILIATEIVIMLIEHFGR